jgi:4-diphosphocytidyl-2-C-methyl-D-erythritol kinase
MNMTKLSAKSFTRITLALDIVGKIRNEPFAGFHELGAIKHKIDLHDVISVEESDEMGIECKDPRVPIDAANICWKACEILKSAFGISQNALIGIKKNIPVQGGLAGGSANAATAFLLLNELWNLKADNATLGELSRKAGMDVPFYFAGDTAFDTEAGGILQPLPTSLRFEAILIMPDFGVSTKEAYREIDYSLIGQNSASTRAMREAFLNNDRMGVINNMHNDFELTVFKQFPLLGQIKKQLLDEGCANAVLSGSGSCVLGILESQKDFERIKSRIGMRALLVSSKQERNSERIIIDKN